MAATRHAVLSGDQVLNVILYDPEHPFDPGEGLLLLEAGAAEPTLAPGWTHGPAGFAPPPQSAPPAPTPAQALAERKAALAVERYARESAGVWFQASGATAASLAASDTSSQAKLGNAYQLARDGFWRDGTPWKMADANFVPMAAADIKALSLKVAAYVAACYAHEAQLAATLASDPATDITQGWPANT